MKKLILILFFTTISVYSNIYIDSINTTNYPQIQANYYKLNNRPFILDSIFLFEQSDVIKDVNFNKISESERKLNSYFLVDVSSSMRKNNKIVEDIINKFINEITPFDSVGIITFNQNSFVNTFKTNNVDDLKSSLSILSYSGSSNLNEMFFNSPLSIDKIFNPNEDYILITDKQSTGDYQRIKDFFKDNNINLHIIYLSTNSNSIYKDMLNGYYLDYNKFKSKHLLLAEYLLNRLKKVDYYKITWTTNLCTDKVKGNIVQSPLFDFDFEYTIPNADENILSIVPNSHSQINFNLNQEKVFSSNLIAISKDIEILSITSSNPEFKIKSNIKTLFKEKTSILNIGITPTENKFYSTNITISTECDNYIIPIELGEYSFVEKDVKLVLNNGKDFYCGDTAKFSINGLSPSDRISIDYKYQNVWINIVENYNSNTLTWIVPKLDESELDFRMRFKETNYKQFNLKEFTIKTDKINLIKLSNENAFAGFVTTDNKLNNLKIDSNEDLGIIASSLNNTELLSWSKNNNQIVAVRKNNNFPLIFDAKENDSPITLGEVPSLITTTDWNYLSNQIAFGTNDGNLYFYNDLGNDKAFTFKIKISNSSIDEIKYHPNKNLLVINDAFNNLQFINITNQSNNFIIKTFNSKIKRISWSNFGDSLFIADENQLYIFQLNVFQGVYSFTKEIEKSSPLTFDDIEYDFQNKLFYLRKENKISIYNNLLTLLHSYSIDLPFNDLYALNKNILVSNDISRKLIIRDLSKYKDINFSNDILYSKKLNIIKKTLNLKDLDLPDICLNIPIDTLITNFIYNSNNKSIVIDSLHISNNSNITLNLSNNILFSKQNTDLNITIGKHDIGHYEHIIKLFSNKDTFSFKIEYNVINDDIEKLTTYVDLGKVNYNTSETITNALLRNFSNQDIKITNIKVISPNEKITYSLTDSIIKSNEIFELDFIFSPSDLKYSQLLIQIYTENACSPFEFIIFGEGVSPAISVNEFYNLDSVNCKNDNFNEVKIKNTGNGKLNIIDINNSNNDIKIINNSNILSNEDLILSFEYLGNEIGEIIDTVTFITNSIYNSSNTFQFNWKGYKFDSDIEFTSRLNFKNPEKNKVLNSEFIVFNNGSIKENIQFKSISNSNLFEISAINKNNLNPNDSTNVFVKFNVGANNLLYEEIFELIDYCGNSKTITFSVDLRDAKPLLSSLSFIDFGEIFCNNISKDTIIEIKNIGGADLTINNIELKGEDKSNFELLDWSGNETVKTDESIFLTIRYNPLQIQEDNAYLELQTDSQINNGISVITLLGIFRNSKIDADISDISFINVESNVNHTQTFTLTNNGNIIENLTLSIDNPIFNINPPIISDFKKGDEQVIIITFLGGAPDATFLGKLNIDAKCNSTELLIKAIVKGTNYFELSSKNITAKTGDLVDLPINFSNPENLVINNSFVFETELVVDKNIITSIDLESYIENDKRIIPLTYTINNMEDKQLGNIKIKVTLGNKDFSDIEFRNSKIIDDERYYFEFKPSKLTIDNICIEGGNRFVEGAEVFNLLPIYPNPTNDYINISYSLIEDTFTNLKIVDMMGSEVMNIINNEVIAHSNTLKVDTRKYAVGTYFIILTTSNNQITRRFTIIR